MAVLQASWITVAVLQASWITVSTTAQLKDSGARMVIIDASTNPPDIGGPTVAPGTGYSRPVGATLSAAEPR